MPTCQGFYILMLRFFLNMKKLLFFFFFFFGGGGGVFISFLTIDTNIRENILEEKLDNFSVE